MTGRPLTDPPPDTVAVVRVPALLSVRTTAQLLDLSPRTVRRRIHDGTIPAVREHDRLAIRADDLRQYIETLERTGQHPGRRRHPTRPPGEFDFLR